LSRILSPDPTAAFAPGYLGWRLVEIRVVKRRAAESITTALEEFSVHVDDVSRPRLLVKAVHVLRADEKTVLQRVLKFGDGKVCWVRLGRRSYSPPHGIELPHHPRIAVPSFGRCDLFESVTSPKTTHTTKSRNAAFGAHSGSSENEDAVSGGKR
jgi:hypothetical protein